MNMQKKAYLSLDTAYGHGVVVLFFEQEILFSSVLKEKMAHGKELCSAMEAAIQVASEQGFFLAGVFCGLGPGSFVGVRIALATALGFTAATGLPIMGICSHQALAHSVTTSDRFHLMMKASGDQMYVSAFEQRDGNLLQTEASRVMLQSDFLLSLDETTIVTDVNPASLGRPPHLIQSLYGPTSHGVWMASMKRLAMGLLDESSAIKPNYIKNPNVSLPKKNIVIAG